MDYELTTQKQKDGSHLVKNTLTNEPVAILTKPKYAYKANSVQAEWHPDFKLLHPEVSENLLHRNFDRTYDSISQAVNVITGKSQQFARGEGIHKDPIKTHYIGTEEQDDGYGGKRAVHKWHMFDGENQIGTMTSFDDPNKIHRGSDVKMAWNKEYLEKNPISDAVKESATKKHGKTDLETSMHRLRYMIDNREKEPRFIGTTKSKSAEMNVFKTKMNPEEASKAYEEHLKTKLDSGYTFARHSPTVFSAHKAADSEYASGYTHHIISVPGEIHHMSATTSHPSYQYGEKNKQIVESVEWKTAKRIEHKLSLEDYLFIAKV